MQHSAPILRPALPLVRQLVRTVQDYLTYKVRRLGGAIQFNTTKEKEKGKRKRREKRESEERERGGRGEKDIISV